MTGVRPVRLLVVAAALVALVAGCGSGVPDIDLPSAPTSVVGGPTSIPPDYSGVQLPIVPGAASTTIPSIGPGSSRIEGTVKGSDGAVVPGAIVRVERFVDDFFTHLDVVAAPDGTFVVDRVKGGRYRARAWRAPDLAVDKPVVFFLEDGKTQPINFTLSKRDGLLVRATIAPNPPLEDEPANLAIAVSNRVVDEGGIVRSSPIAGLTVDLLLPSDWFTTSSDPTVTDAGGRAFWEVECTRSGSNGVSVAVGDQTVDLGLPACDVEPPPTTTTRPSSTATTSGSGQSATTTTRRGGGNNRP